MTRDANRHPGPVSVELPHEIRDGIVAQARADYPNEMCGLIIGDGPAAAGGRALRFEPTRNKAASPLRYEIHPDDLLRLTIATDDADEVFWGIVHSHTHTPAVPSPTDVGLAFYPDALYLLVSLSEDEADPATGAPSLRPGGSCRRGPRGRAALTPSRAVGPARSGPPTRPARRPSAAGHPSFGTFRSSRYASTAFWTQVLSR